MIMKINVTKEQIKKAFGAVTDEFLGEFSPMSMLKFGNVEVYRLIRLDNEDSSGIVILRNVETGNGKQFIFHNFKEMQAVCNILSEIEKLG